MDLSSTSEDLVAKVTTAVADLRWLSETDAAFEVLFWPELAPGRISPEQVLNQAQLPSETPIEGIDLETFLAPATELQPWFTAEEAQIAKQFQFLQHLLEQHLTDIQVYRCGTLELDLYIVGYDPGSGWLVLHTTAVET